jgi:Uri superfamily endonuclease
MNNRSVLLSEVIEELTAELSKNGECEINSIGTSSGSDSSFIFRNNENEREIRVKAFRNKKKGGC